MKKIAFLLSILLFPLIINASTASIKSISIMGTDAASVGSEFSESFKVNFLNIKKGTDDTLGIWLVGFEIVYDEDAFIIESISSDGNVWASTVYKQNGKTYVISQFNNDPYHNVCSDGILYCADYIVTLKFYVKDTTKTSSTIKMRDVEAGVFQVSGSLNAEYDVSDMIELNYPNETSMTIKINKPTNATVKEPKSIITNKPTTKKPKATTKKTTTNKKTTTASKVKSTNNELKSLIISGYPFEFVKDTKTYYISVPDEVTLLDIEAKPEDTKATVEIIGANDLKANDGKVLINVKAENGDVNTYTIVIKDQEEENDETGIFDFRVTKKQTIIAGIVIGSLLLIIIISCIAKSIGDRKIDKKLDSY